MICLQMINVLYFGDYKEINDLLLNIGLLQEPLINTSIFVRNVAEIDNNACLGTFPSTSSALETRTVPPITPLGIDFFMHFDTTEMHVSEVPNHINTFNTCIITISCSYTFTIHTSALIKRRRQCQWSKYFKLSIFPKAKHKMNIIHSGSDIKINNTKCLTSYVVETE